MFPQRSSTRLARTNSPSGAEPSRIRPMVDGLWLQALADHPHIGITRCNMISRFHAPSGKSDDRSCLQESSVLVPPAAPHSLAGDGCHAARLLSPLLDCRLVAGRVPTGPPLPTGSRRWRSHAIVSNAPTPPARPPCIAPVFPRAAAHAARGRRRSGSPAHHLPAPPQGRRRTPHRADGEQELGHDANPHRREMRAGGSSTARPNPGIGEEIPATPAHPGSSTVQAHVSAWRPGAAIAGRSPSIDTTASRGVVGVLRCDPRCLFAAVDPATGSTYRQEWSRRRRVLLLDLPRGMTGRALRTLRRRRGRQRRPAMWVSSQRSTSVKTSSRLVSLSVS